MSLVTVAGMGVRSPFGRGASALLDGLCSGRSALAPYDPFVRANLRFPVAAAVDDGVLRANGVVSDERGEALLEGCIRDAIGDAFGDVSSLAGVAPASRVALVVGTSSSGIGPFCDALRAGRSRDDTARYASATHRVARLLGFSGPIVVVCSVCASGALAIAEAAQMIADGTVDLAVAAGFDPLEPFVGAGFDSLGALTDVPRPFRTERRGLALGEGAAAVVLARSGDPRVLVRRGTVLGWGESADAHHLTAPDPQGRGVACAIERALRCASLGAEMVGVVNAHGTGTPFNDAMETAALVRVFGPRAGERPVYTVKGAIGHTLGAAGAIEAVVSWAAMNGRCVPPTVTGGPLDPRCNLAVVVDRALVSDAAVTLSLSSAFGGTNCALLLGAAAAGVS